MRIAVIADDLTGALDTGVQFTQWGYTTQLTETPEHSTMEVTIINTDTRNKDPEIAYNITYNVAEKLNHHDIIYKKIDSTLRGNPGPELQAILDATGETKAILTPTYPSIHRRVEDGHLYIADKPITETDYIYEYRKKTSYIPDILAGKSMIHAIKIHENIPPIGITIIDSETEKDLQQIAARCTRVMAGSAGLADAICQTLRAPPPVLTVIGSMRIETSTQVKQLQRRLGAAMIPLDTIKALNQIPQPETLRKATDALNQGQDAILTSTPSTETIEKTKQEAKRLNLLQEELETKIMTALAVTAESLLNHTLSGLIITGGSTAIAITKKLGIENIQILDEVQPGVPVIKLDQLTAVTKAGGFGQADILIQATQFLKRRHC